MNGIITIDWARATSLGMLALFVFLAGMLAYGFWRAQRDETNTFNIFDLLMEDGKVSNVKFILMIALGVTTWMMVNLTLTGRVTEGYFGSYCLTWASPTLVRLWMKSGSPPTPPAGS